MAQTPELLIHDLDGNLVRDGRWMYYWDAENRLTRVITVAGAASSFRRVDWKYDALGRRVRQTSYALSNGMWQVVEDVKLVNDPVLFGRHVAELNGTNHNLLRGYIWGLDLSETLDGAGGVGGLLWVRVAGGPAAGTHFVCYDGNGNVWNMVSASTGSETARYEYGPFGEQLRLSGPAGRFTPFRFSTKRTEEFTGLVLYEYRAYSPTSGRWLSRDPLGEPGFERLHRVGVSAELAAPSLRAFVRNDPANQCDRLGLTDTETKSYWDWVKEMVEKVKEAVEDSKDGKCPKDPCRVPSSLNAICTCLYEAAKKKSIEDMIQCVCMASPDSDCEKQARKTIESVYGQK